ncbi:ABC transporter substrate-binding protein [Kushneria aurantia]|uniref:ABC transporter substrate-binding protein n=1 Tax=Kushneria aurantia TaxID=504092 RepID=A0ABV6G747_9GAMM|nr:ABC transporter substrate-binding protein [Kushneria aurantia]
MQLVLKWCVGAALAALVTTAHADISVEDIEGRHVTLEAPAERIVLAEGRQLIALSLLDDNPAHWLVGWGSDLKRYSALYDIYRQRAPELDALPIVGDGPGPAGISTETIISLDPDAVVLSRSQVPPSQAQPLLARLEAAGIPALFIDFATDPLDDTVPSMRTLGQLLGREDQAQRFIDIYTARRDAVLDDIEDDAGSDGPSVMIETHAGMTECCNSPGQGSFDHFVRLLGADNIGADVLKGKSGRLDPEYVLTRDPQVYIATGGSYLRDVGGLVLGPGVSEEEARQSLEHVLQRPLISHLSAVEQGRVHGLYHHLINTPLNVVVLEKLAQWLHPGRFADIDADETMATFNADYLSDPLTGTLWVDLQPGD